MPVYIQYTIVLIPKKVSFLRVTPLPRHLHHRAPPPRLSDFTAMSTSRYTVAPMMHNRNPPAARAAHLVATFREEKPNSHTRVMYITVHPRSGSEQQPRAALTVSREREKPPRVFLRHACARACRASADRVYTEKLLLPAAAAVFPVSTYTRACAPCVEG